MQVDASSHRASVLIPDGLSAEQLRKSLDGIPSTLQGMRSPMGESSRSECVAGMDMLNDMFQRQARRLESQLYQRAQDQRTIEVAQRQAQFAMAKVKQLELQSANQAARLQSNAVELQGFRCLMKEVRDELLNTCEALSHDVTHLQQILERESPQTLGSVTLRCTECPSLDQLRSKATSLDTALREAERATSEPLGHVGHVETTPTTHVVMGAPSNPLHDLSVVADYASKATVSKAIMGSPLSSATRSLSCDMMEGDDHIL